MLLPSWEILVNDPLFNSITLKIILVRHWHNILFDLYWPFATQTHFDLLRLRMFQFNPFLSNSVSTPSSTFKTTNRLWALRVSRRKLWVVRSSQFPIVHHCATVKCAYAYMWVIRTKIISLGICKCRRFFFFRAFLFILKFFFQFLTTQNLGSVLIAKGNGQTGSDVNLCIAAVVWK